MGAWGPGLYENDEAADLKSAISLVCRVPVDGNRLADLLAGMQVSTDPNDERGATFWLVLADQFERKQISCPKAFATALSIIQSKADLDRMKDLGANDAFLKKRALVLKTLADRLEAPRPPRPRPTPKKPPEFVLEIGEIYAFPTLNGFACHPYRVPSAGPFLPNGWGALVVLDRGRAFDWLPWCALASLTVDPAHRPTMKDALNARLITHLQTMGAARCVPKKSDVKTMQLELLGRVALDSTRVQPVLSKWSIASAIEYGWSIAYAGYSTEALGPPVGVELSSLVTDISQPPG